MADGQDRAHLFRVAAFFVVCLLLFFTARTLLVPKDFGIYGPYRAGALDDARARPIAYAGQAMCLGCHGDVGDLRKTGRHAQVACESCHGPLARHASGDEPATPVRPDGRATCLRCHLASRSKPVTFPQIAPKEHAEDGPCIACHKPHAPNL